MHERRFLLRGPNGRFLAQMDDDGEYTAEAVADAQLFRSLREARQEQRIGETVVEVEETPNGWHFGREFSYA